jgi:gamma-tubulin complex component 2
MNWGVGVDERRTERIQITTRETMTSRTESPERRPEVPEPLPVQQPEQPKASEATRAYPVVPRPQAAKADVPQRKPIHSQKSDV